MAAKFYTKNGDDIWRLKERIVYDFKNLETGQVVTCQTMKETLCFEPVIMTKPKSRAAKRKTERKKRAVGKVKSRYKGVSKVGKKWRTQVYDKILQRNIHLGTFEAELLAAAAYQDCIGNEKEARRLRNEYEEGDRMAEEVNVKVTGGQQVGDFCG